MAHPYKKLEMGFWSSLPCVISAALLFVYLMPKHISGLGNVMPVLPLMPVFFWGLSPHPLMPYWFVFLLGLFMDAATGLPMGISSLLYIVFLMMLGAQHKYIHKEGFVIKWGYFAALIAALLLLNWLALFMIYAKAPGLESAAIQWLLSLCVYPLFHTLFGRLDAHIAERRWKLERRR